MGNQHRRLSEIRWDRNFGPGTSYYKNKKCVCYIGWASYYSNTEYYRIVSKEEEKEVYRKAFEEKAFKEIIRYYIDEHYDSFSD